MLVWSLLRANPLVAALLGLILVGLPLSYGWGRHTGTRLAQRRQDAAISGALLNQARLLQKDVEARARQDSAEATIAAADREQLKSRIVQLLAIPPQVLVRTVTVKSDAQGDCQDDGVSNEFWTLFREAGEVPPTSF